MAAIRAWFAQRDFVEVDPAALQVSPGNETHLHAFSTELIGPDGTRRALHLHTSPEFALKKLLAAGESRPFSLGHVFRNRERGALHHPEFTMLEWYRAGEPYDAVIADTMALVRLAAETAGCHGTAARRAVHSRPHAEVRAKGEPPSTREGGASFEAPLCGAPQDEGRGRERPSSEVSFRARVCDLRAEPERLAVDHAFVRFAGFDVLGTLSAAGAPDRDALAERCRGAGIRIVPDDTWSDLFSRVLVERVEPRLGIGRATVLDRYPVPEAALARPAPDDPRVAERFELYLCGVEIANGFGELTDAAEQRRRFAADMDEKERLYGERYPVDEDFLRAVDAMPDASGVALGLDRLVMLAAGAERVEDVIWTPVA